MELDYEKIRKYIMESILKYENGCKKTMHHNKTIREMEDYKINCLCLKHYGRKK